MLQVSKIFKIYQILWIPKRYFLEILSKFVYGRFSQRNFRAFLQCSSHCLLSKIHYRKHIKGDITQCIFPSCSKLWTILWNIYIIFYPKFYSWVEKFAKNVSFCLCCHENSLHLCTFFLIWFEKFSAIIPKYNNLWQQNLSWMCRCYFFQYVRTIFSFFCNCIKNPWQRQFMTRKIHNSISMKEKTREKNIKIYESKLS